MRVNTPEDLWKYVQLAGGGDCWPFVGARNSKGYGEFRLAGARVKAHRIAFQMGHGIDPAGFLVCHRCDNPPCCNPDHLFLGTPLDNNRDCKAKGRNAAGQRHPMAKLDVATVRLIRVRRAAGELGKDLAAEFGVTPQLISLIVNNRIWVTA